VLRSFRLLTLEAVADEELRPDEIRQTEREGHRVRVRLLERRDCIARHHHRTLRVDDAGPTD